MTITGNLKTLELAELLQWLSQGTKTGVLVIENGTLEKKIYFDKGKIVFSESNNPYEHLGSFLIREGLIDETTLARAVKLQETTQILLGKVLVTLGSISEDELHQILRRKIEESIYELFTWETGDFHFLPDKAPTQPGIPLSLEVTNIVLEALRRLDESRHTGQPVVEDHSGRYSLEIKEVLNAELEKSSASEEIKEIEEIVNLDEDESGLTDLPVIAEEIPVVIEELSDIADDTKTDIADDTSTESATYYQSARGKKPSKAPIVAAAAALIMILVGAASYFLLMRADPADGSTSGFGIENSQQSSNTIPASLELQEPMPLETEHALANGATIQSQPTSDNRLPAAHAQTELAVLKPEPQQLPPSSRETEPKMIAPSPPSAEDSEPRIETTVEARVAEAAAEEEPFEIAEIPTEQTDSAGGDEPPSLSGRLQTIPSFNTPIASDLADEIVEPTPQILPDLEPEILQIAEPIEDTTPTVHQGDLVEPGPGVNPPVMLSRPKPNYPQSALRLGKEAVVTVRLLVDENGSVIEAERIGSKSGMGFDQEAIKAARVTKWQPATKDGVQVRMWAELRVQFRP